MFSDRFENKEERDDYMSIDSNVRKLTTEYRSMGLSVPQVVKAVKHAYPSAKESDIQFVCQYI